jgi:putative restriction endonuclease
MKFFVGVTDNKWFEYLAQLQPDEVNFWQPGGNISFKAVPNMVRFFLNCIAPIISLWVGDFLSVIHFYPFH